MFKNIVLKLSGEFFKGKDSIFASESIAQYAEQIKKAKENSVNIAVVVGGGNIFRGKDVAEDFCIGRYDSDGLGILGTVMNGILLKGSLRRLGVKSTLMAPFSFLSVDEVYSRDKALELFSKGEVVIFAGGLGLPYLSTDTTAAMKAIDLGADVVLKATKVDGVYDKDPKKYSDAKRYEKISLSFALEKGLKVMDLSAMDLCRDHSVKINVFNALRADNIEKIIMGQDIGTLIY